LRRGRPPSSPMAAALPGCARCCSGGRRRRYYRRGRAGRERSFQVFF
jgi:hypothetical protein